MREIGATLFQSLLVAVSLNDEAAKEFDDAVSEARTGAHHPNGAQTPKRLHRAWHRAGRAEAECLRG
jgi:hypothetical protein